MPISPTNISKSSTSYSAVNKAFRAVYGLARYGISIYGQANSGDGYYSNVSKASTSYSNITKN